MYYTNINQKQISTAIILNNTDYKTTTLTREKEAHYLIPPEGIAKYRYRYSCI